MTEKQQYALDTVLSKLPDDVRDGYAQIAQCAISLGYKPVLKGVRKDYADFQNAKTKKTLLKINANPEYRWIAIKFFAVQEYTPLFESALQAWLKYWKQLGHEAKCLGCGKCDGTQGYRVRLPEGGQGYLCGYGVIPLADFKAENIDEVKRALEAQHRFELNQQTAETNGDE